MNFAFDLEHLPFIFLAIIVAFTFHEYAHAASAYRFGDPTAHSLGRVTLNPASHISLLGLIFIMLLGFGWARPVPVDRSHFKRPRLMGIVVSALGPLSNLVIALIAALLLAVIFASGVMDQASIGVHDAVALTFFYLVHINLLLFLFNLLPLPPLDGYRIMEDVAPESLRPTMRRYEPWGVYIFLLIVFITPLFNLTIGPLLKEIQVWRDTLIYTTTGWFGVSIDWRAIFEL